MITVYTAGSFRLLEDNYGNERKVAGYGIWFGYDDEKNEGGRVRKRRTCCRAELVAILEALKATEDLVEDLLILSSSTYCVECLNERKYIWQNTFLCSKIFSEIEEREERNINVYLQFIEGIKIDK